MKRLDNQTESSMTQAEFDELVTARGRLAAGPWTWDDNRWTRVDTEGKICGWAREDTGGEGPTVVAWVIGHGRATWPVGLVQGTRPPELLLLARGFIDLCLVAQRYGLVNPITLYAVEGTEEGDLGGAHPKVRARRAELDAEIQAARDEYTSKTAAKIESAAAILRNVARREQMIAEHGARWCVYACGTYLQERDGGLGLYGGQIALFETMRDAVEAARRWNADPATQEHPAAPLLVRDACAVMIADAHDTIRKLDEVSAGANNDRA